MDWERETIQPKYGINEGVEYTHTIGVAELYDYEWFFGGFPYKVRGETARSLGVESGTKVVYFPRRSFDMWNTRYFVLPEFPNGWNDEFRGYAAFLHETEPIYPPAGAHSEPRTEARRSGPGSRRRTSRSAATASNSPAPGWSTTPAACPRWRACGGPTGPAPCRRCSTPTTRSGMTPTRPPSIPTAWSGSTTTSGWPCGPTSPAQSPRSSETVKVSYPSPQRVELDAKLDSPGIVVLADVNYPGWKLTIDGQPAPIIPVNRLMRGAAVKEGSHRLVYTFDPASFRIGGKITLAALAASALFAVFCAIRSRSRPLEVPRFSSRFPDQ